MGRQIVITGQDGKILPGCTPQPVTFSMATKGGVRSTNEVNFTGMTGLAVGFIVQDEHGLDLFSGQLNPPARPTGPPHYPALRCGAVHGQSG